MKPCILLLDEFHHYDGVPVIRKMLSEGRKYNLRLFCSHQGPNQIIDRALHGDLLRNTGNKVIFKLALRPDIEIALSSIGIRDRIYSEYLPRLGLGEAIVSLSGISQPFKISTEPFPETERISDEEIKNKIKLLPQPDVEEEEAEAEQLDNKFLNLVSENPYSSTSGITDEMGIMRAEGYRLKRELVNKGLIIEEEVRTGIGRPKKVLSLTDAAYDLLNIEKQGEPAHHGGIEHIMMRDEIAEILEDNLWAVTIEWNMADIKAENLKKKVAVEVETCKEYNPEQILKNIQRDLRWADQIVIISPNKKTKGDIQRLVNKSGIEKVVLLTYSDVRDKILEVI